MQSSEVPKASQRRMELGEWRVESGEQSSDTILRYCSTTSTSSTDSDSDSDRVTESAHRVSMSVCQCAGEDGGSYCSYMIIRTDCIISCIMYCILST